MNMKGIPLCRFVNKRIDWEPKFDISECSPIFGKVLRQTRANYHYQKMASSRAYLLVLGHAGCCGVFCLILVFLIQNWFLTAFPPRRAPLFRIRIWGSWAVPHRQCCSWSRNFFFLLRPEWGRSLLTYTLVHCVTL